MDDVTRKINKQSRVVMIVHYFGFPTDTAAVRKLCDIHGLQMLEDCAHAFFGVVLPHGRWAARVTMP